MRLPRLLDGLAFRIGLLLTVALFPIGLIAVSLTKDIARSVEVREEGAILALTAEAAAGEESLMVGARTVVRGFVNSLPILLKNPEGCSDVFASFVGGGSEYSFAGYVDASGILRCASDLVNADLSQSESTLAMEKNPAPRIDMRTRSRVTGQPIIILQEPVRTADGRYDGYVSLSIPIRHNARRVPQIAEARPLAFVTFNNLGTLLASNIELEAVKTQLPLNMSLVDFVGGARRSFVAESVGGELRSFAVVPIFAGQLYALGSWPQGSHGLSSRESISPLLFVSLMWMVSLGVAFMAVHRLAIKNITELRHRMSQFIATRRIVRSDEDTSRPLEFREITRTWEDLAETVMREEAELENIIHGRTVLLKEVHHRVKNNLQLISSIVSMKIRKAATPEARNALKEVQMRVSSISTVHQALYNTTAASLVEADELLQSIVSKTIEATAAASGSFRVDTVWDKVGLYPDQAVPLSLLTAEAVTNALKYLGRPADGFPWLRVEMRRVKDGAAELVIVNSKGVPLIPPERIRGSGLGLNLIRAFALQMRGSVEIEEDLLDQFVVRVEFRTIPFDSAPQEGTLPDTIDWSYPPERPGAVKRAEAPKHS